VDNEKTKNESNSEKIVICPHYLSSKPVVKCFGCFEEHPVILRSVSERVGRILVWMPSDNDSSTQRSILRS
jgi:hypothetical protein